MSDLDLLRDIGPHLRQPAFEDLLATRRRRTRRARLATASLVAVAAAAVVGVLAATGDTTRTDPPPVVPSPTPLPSPTEGLQIPAGQQTITSDIGPADIHGWDVLATVTNSQPEHRGDSELSATVPDTREAVSTYCRGESDLYYFYDIGDGGGGWDRCSPDADTVLAPGFNISDLVVEEPVGDPQTVRMWIARPSAAWVRCQHRDSGDCSMADAQPIVNPDAEFGFQVYAHESTRAFPLLGNAGNGEPYPLQALSTLGGTGWLVDQAVVAAADADHLAFELPASNRHYLIDVYTGPGPHLERCRAQHADELPDWATTDRAVYEPAFDKVCGVDVRLVVDGTPSTPTTTRRPAATSRSSVSSCLQGRTTRSSSRSCAATRATSSTPSSCVPGPRSPERRHQMSRHVRSRRARFALCPVLGILALAGCSGEATPRVPTSDDDSAPDASSAAPRAPVRELGRSRAGQIPVLGRHGARRRASGRGRRRTERLPRRGCLVRHLARQRCVPRPVDRREGGARRLPPTAT